MVAALASGESRKSWVPPQHQETQFEGACLFGGFVVFVVFVLFFSEDIQLRKRSKHHFCKTSILPATQN